MFRDLNTFMQTSSRGAGRLEVLSLAVMAEGATAEDFANWGASSAPASVSVVASAPAVEREATADACTSGEEGLYAGLLPRVRAIVFSLAHCLAQCKGVRCGAVLRLGGINSSVRCIS